MSDNVTLTSPIGRIINGDVRKAQTKKMNGEPLIDKNGTPYNRYYLGLAIPKIAPDWAAFHAALREIAQAGFPQLFDAGGNCQRPDFAWKIVDGDSTELDQNGRRYCDRPHNPGHFVLHLTRNNFAPQLFTTDPIREMAADDGFKRGDYARVVCAVKANGNATRPGLYVEHTHIQRVGYGDPINTGPDGAAIFAAAPVGALPAGASATPVVSGPAPQGAQGTPAPQGAQGTPAPPFADGPRMYIVGGVSYTEAQLRAKNWNDEQLATLDRV